MKFEEQIKQSLNNHEEAYNPAAWDAMKAKLDAKYPVAPKGGNGKWWIAAGIATVAITSLLIWNNSTTSTNQIAKQNQENISEDSGRMDSNAKNNPQSTSTNDLMVQSEETNSEIAFNNSIQRTVEIKSNLSVKSLDVGEGKKIEDSKLNDYSENTEDPMNFKPVIEQDGGPTKCYAATVFSPSANNLCFGKNLIENIDKRKMYILDANKKTITTIDGEKSKMVEFTKAGAIHFGYYHQEVLTTFKSIEIEEAPEISVQRIDEDIKYQDGLPVVSFVSDDNITWSANGQSFKGKEATFHFFNQGNETIELTQKYGQCSTSKSISVEVEKYNLQAPEAFKIDGFNKTWIPHALTERNVEFKLQIIDMSNGGIVYQTIDANLPWNGVDIRTGRVADEPIKYAWRVQIMNPKKGEPSIYQGTVRKL